MFIRELRRHFPARVPEWVNAFTLTAWGAYVILHPEVFDHPEFIGLQTLIWFDVSAYAFWGLVALTVGWMRAGALFINGAHSRTPIVRLAASAISAFVWSQIVIGLLVSGKPSAALVMYSSAVIMDLISAYRASSDVAIAEGTRRAARQGAEGRVGSNSGNLG